MTTKTCTKCNENKATTEFYKNKHAADGLRTECKACKYAVLAKWRKANPEKAKRIKQTHNNKVRASMTVAQKAAWNSVNSTRLRSDLSSADLYGGLTYKEAAQMTLPFVEERLRLEAETGVVHHVDHIIPLAAGGKHEVSNLQVLTAEENIAKGATE